MTEGKGNDFNQIKEHVIMNSLMIKEDLCKIVEYYVIEHVK